MIVDSEVVSGDWESVIFVNGDKSTSYNWANRKFTNHIFAFYPFARRGDIMHDEFVVSKKYNADYFRLIWAR